MISYLTSLNLYNFNFDLVYNIFYDLNKNCNVTTNNNKILMQINFKINKKFIKT